MYKIELHRKLCDQLADTYERKNHDYGDSFALVRKKFPNAILIRLNDKLNRLETLMQGVDQQVNDENIEDSLMDLANYALMEIVERCADADIEVAPIGRDEFGRVVSVGKRSVTLDDYS